MADVVKVLQEERSLLQKRLSALDAAIRALSGGEATGGEAPGGTANGRKPMSAATKRKLSLAAKARWAKVKTKKEK
jgi:hypothetical protein